MRNYYEMYLKLVETVDQQETEAKEEILSFIDKLYETFGRYIESIYRMERLLPILKFKYEGEDYRDRVMDLDNSRRTAHEAAMAGCRSINKICESYDMEPFFTEYEERSFYTDMIHALYNDFVNAGKWKGKEEH